ncbi:MAG: OadG family protein [Eubacteriales bacterium]|nr:OadG family protein [Eubacteriales bacterium]
MRKFKGFLVAAAAAALLTFSMVPAGAESETETAAAVTEIAEETEAAAAEAAEETEAETAEAAAVDPTTGLLASDIATLQSYAEGMISQIVALTDDQVQEYLNPSSVLVTKQDNMTASIQSWADNKGTLGEFQNVNSHEVRVNDKSLIVETHAAFANQEGVVTTTLNRDTLNMESMVFSTGANSFAQDMKEAALNTLMGLCIVFFVLVFLSFLISRFAYIAKLEEKFKNRKAPKQPVSTPAAAPAPAVQEVEEEVVDDGELIAVIAAAIAAAEGTSTDGFVVRSIRKSNRNRGLRV